MKISAYGRSLANLVRSLCKSSSQWALQKGVYGIDEIWDTCFKVTFGDKVLRFDKSERNTNLKW